jgi:hypoxanthine phosphoribosyltransferase
MTESLPPHITVSIESALEPSYLDIPPHYEEDLKSVLIPHGLILNRISKLAHDIVEDNDKPILCICVLKGGHQFFTDLLDVIKKLVVGKKKAIQISFEFIRLKSYVGDQSSGHVQITGMDLSMVTGKNVLIIEDIVDTGRSAIALTEEIKKHNPQSMKFATLLYKRTGHEINFRPDYIGFSIPDYFIVGYALDFNEYFRDLNHICIFNLESKHKYLA